jgi:hypothetical protein
VMGSSDVRLLPPSLLNASFQALTDLRSAMDTVESAVAAIPNPVQPVRVILSA